MPPVGFEPKISAGERPARLLTLLFILQFFNPEAEGGMYIYIFFSETIVYFYQTTRCHITEETNPQKTKYLYTLSDKRLVPVQKQTVAIVKKKLVMAMIKMFIGKTHNNNIRHSLPQVTKYWFTAEINTSQRVRLVITSLSILDPFSFLL